jgi:hypothetical protein
VSERRITLKNPMGWFAAGREVARAMALLSDGAFKVENRQGAVHWGGDAPTIGPVRSAKRLYMSASDLCCRDGGWHRCSGVSKSKRLLPALTVG